MSGSGNTRTRFFYNPDRQPTQILRPDGQTIDFGYDTAGRLSTISTRGGQSVYAYNEPSCNCSGLGRPSSITMPNEVINYSYDGELLTSAASSRPVSGSVGQAYDANFRLVTLTVNGQDPVSFGYDNDSLLTSAGALTLTRNPQNGLLTGTTFGVVSDSWTYNSFGEPAGYTATIIGSPIFSSTYTRDTLGRIETKNETVQGGVTDSYLYSYDPAGRLSDVTKNGALISHYEYDDPNGNRNFSTMSGLTVTYTHDDQDRLVEAAAPSPQLPVDYTHTANGELLTKTLGTDTTTYNYDVQSNLMAVTLPNGPQVEYIVDALNQRIGKKVNGVLVQGCLYQDGLKLIVELDGANQMVSRFIYAGKVNVPAYMIKGGATYRIVTDLLGSPRLVVNTTDGQVVQRMDYDEFGNVLLDTNPGFQPFGFAGGLFDPDTKLVHFGARDYDAVIGRWLSRDPIQEEGGLNLYVYVQNDPIRWIDPFGLSNCSSDQQRLSQFADPSQVEDLVNGGIAAYATGGISGVQNCFAGNPRYAFNRDMGWIDLQHVAAAAGVTADYFPIAGQIAGYANEAGELFQGYNPFLSAESRQSYRESAFSLEDMLWNAIGDVRGVKGRLPSPLNLLDRVGAEKKLNIPEDCSCQ